MQQQGYLQNGHFVQEQQYMLPQNGHHAVLTERQLAQQFAHIQLSQQPFQQNLNQPLPPNYQKQPQNLQTSEYQDAKVEITPHQRHNFQNYQQGTQQETNPSQRYQEQQIAYFQSQQRQKHNQVYQNQVEDNQPLYTPQNHYVHQSEPQNHIHPQIQPHIEAVKPKNKSKPKAKAKTKNKQNIIKSIKSYQQLNKESSESRHDSKAQNVFYNESKEGSFRKVSNQQIQIPPKLPASQMSFSNINSGKLNKTANLEDLRKRKGKTGAPDKKRSKKTKRDSVKRPKYNMQRAKKRADRHHKKKKKEYTPGDRSYKVRFRSLDILKL